MLEQIQMRLEVFIDAVLANRGSHRRQLKATVIKLALYLLDFLQRVVDQPFAVDIAHLNVINAE